MTPFRLDGKNAVVTGAGSGIGQAIAQLFAGQGAAVWVVDRDEPAAAATAAAIRAAGGRAEVAALDVADERAVGVLAAALPPVDVLVNNAGVGHVGNLLGTAAGDLERLFSVNVRGVFNFCKAFAPPMMDRRAGSVVNMASIGGIIAVRDRLAYTTTKFAVVGLTKALALDHSATGVRFNCICPGRVETPFVKKRLAESPDPAQAYREMSATQLTGRMARPDEIAAAALYLAADESAMVTGSSLLIDGGWSAEMSALDATPGVFTGVITNLGGVEDIRFPTSRTHDGSDAMNRDPDYSAAYVVIETDRGDGVEGHGLTFTIGRGTEIVVAAVRALRPLVVGQPVAAFTGAPGAFWKHLTGDSQLRWLGPEKGVIQLATAAVVNGLWDLWAKLAGKPLWKLLADMSPAAIVELVDWRYLTDALTPDDARRMLERLVPTRAAREAELRATGYPAYSTSCGWLGYPDEKVRRLCREALAEGFTRFKIKVGESRADDARRAALVRAEIGPAGTLMLDANQRWDVGQAIEWTSGLAASKPLWIEEPTSPDDVLGHAAIARALEPLGIGVATGEHCANRVMFKQLLQARAIAFCQIDMCRLAGVNEVVAVLLLAARFGVPVCPHAGGVGLCEYVQHASMFDYIAVSGALDGRSIEYVDHLHQHFVDPCVIRDGSYQVPSAPGTGITMKPASRAAHAYPDGPVWKEPAGK